MIPVIYFVAAWAYAILFVGIILKDETIGLFGALSLFSLSIFTFVNGLDIFAADNILSLFFSAVTFGTGAYFGVVIGMGKLEETGILK